MSTAPQGEVSGTRKVPRTLRKPHQNSHRARESDLTQPRGLRQWYQNLTRAKCREGCTSSIKICAAPQPERSDTHRQSDERVARSHRKNSLNALCAPRKMSIENLKNDVLLGVDHLLIEVYNAPCLPWNMSTCDAKSSCPKSKSDKTRLSTLWQHRPSSSITAPATKNGRRNHLSFRPTNARVLAACQKYHACDADEKVSDVLAKRRSKLPRPFAPTVKIPRCGHTVCILLKRMVLGIQNLKKTPLYGVVSMRPQLYKL